jgi:streptogramin lyase
MRMHSLSSRSRAVVCRTAAARVSVSAVTGSSLTAAAQTNTGVEGSTSVIAVPGTFHIQQLSVRSDGKLWFVTHSRNSARSARAVRRRLPAWCCRMATSPL